MKMKRIAVLAGFISSITLCVGAVFQPLPQGPGEPKYVVLHPIHLPCGFEAESYTPSEVLGDTKFPMVCGCSEIKGTCFEQNETVYTYGKDDVNYPGSTSE